MVLGLRSKENSVHFTDVKNMESIQLFENEDQIEWSENEAWWIQYKVMMPTDMKHAHRYSREKLFL